MDRYDYEHTFIHLSFSTLIFAARPTPPRILFHSIVPSLCFGLLTFLLSGFDRALARGCKQIGALRPSLTVAYVRTPLQNSKVRLVVVHVRPETESRRPGLTENKPMPSSSHSWLSTWYNTIQNLSATGRCMIQRNDT